MDQSNHFSMPVFTHKNGRDTIGQHTNLSRNPAPTFQPAGNARLRAISARDFLELKLPERELIMAPWLPTQCLSMIYAPRGVGKTHVSLNIACAVSSGVSFLGWAVPKPRNVLFIDGEMPANLLQERLHGILTTLKRETLPDTLSIITPDLQKYGIPDLATQEGQREINRFITPDTSLIILDNLSTLVRSGKENEAESWMPVQTWALQQRAQGRSVLFIHHSGKSGQQRGTSRREDVLDSIISLNHPTGYSPEQGACFEVNFEKARGIYGKDVAPFIARLETDSNGSQTWQTSQVDDSNYEKVIQMAKDNVKQFKIAEALGLNKSTVCRHLKRAKEEGRFSENEELQVSLL